MTVVLRGPEMGKHHRMIKYEVVFNVLSGIFKQVSLYFFFMVPFFNAPYLMDMVRHYDESIYPYTICINKILHLINYHLFVFVLFEQVLPSEDSSSEKIDAVLHGAI